MVAPDTLLLHRYRILQPGQRVGAAIVFQAQDEGRARPALVHLYAPPDERTAQALEAAALRLAALRHPALLPVLDVQRLGERVFLVTPPLPGEPLATALANGLAVAAPQALAWAETVLDALQALHAGDPPLFHGAIRPDTVFLAPNGAVQLALPAFLAGGGTAESGPYTPLEGWQGGESDARGDLYALGATLYLLLAGHAPPDAARRAAAVLDGHPDPLSPVHQANPAAPPALARVVDQALTLSPGQRPASAAAMLAAVRDGAPTATLAVPVAVTGQEERPTETLAAPAVPLVPVPAAPLPTEPAAFATLNEPTRTFTLAAAPVALPEDVAIPSAPAWRWRAALASVAAALVLLTLALGAARWASRRGPGSPSVTPVQPIVAVARTPSPSTTATPSVAASETAPPATATLTPAATPTPAPPTPSPTVPPTRPPATPTPRPVVVPPPTVAPPPPTATVAPSATVAPPSPTATATTALGSDCVTEPGTVFAAVWQDNRALLGCPRDEAITIAFWVEEPFEGGHMFWREDVDQTWAVFDRSKASGAILFGGSWQSDPAWVWDGSDPDGVGLVPPPGLLEPVRGFGWVWRTFLDAQDGPLGWALDAERGFLNLAQLQPFERGQMLRGSDPAIYLLLDDGTFRRR